MANIPKKGLDYFPFEVGVFEDDKIVDLIAERKYIGFVVWLKILALIYKDKGYYYRWGEREPGRIAMKMGRGVTSGTVSDAVETCVEVGLFDKSLYDGHGILSGRGIQRRYADAVKERKYKEVIAEFWLLKEEESAGFSKRAYSGVPDNKTAEKSDKAEINPQSKEEKSKEKQTKENEDVLSDPRETVREQWNAVGADIVSKLDREQARKVGRLLETYGADTIKNCIAKVRDSSFLRGKKNWKADFGWFIDEANFSKVLGGKYDDRSDGRVEFETFNLQEYYGKAIAAGMKYDPPQS